MNDYNENEKIQVVLDAANKLRLKKTEMNIQGMCTTPDKCVSCKYHKFGPLCYEVMEVLAVCDFGFDPKEVLGGNDYGSEI